MLRNLICIFALFLPQKLKKSYLSFAFDYKFSSNSYLGFSWVFPNILVMEDNSRIGHFNFFKLLDRVILKKSSSIGSLNFFTGFPPSDHHFLNIKRDRSLYLGLESAITNQHLFDCTDSIVIDSFTTIAGYRSQFLTHSIDPYISKQVCAPIYIGSYCFIGTSSTFLKGVKVADYTIVGAGSLVSKSLTDSFYVYGGIPASPIKEINRDYLYFNRKVGTVD